MSDHGEIFISLDVETSGPIPGDYSMLSLGACVVGESKEEFYVELKPLNNNAVPEALKVTGFNMDELSKSGVLPEVAMSMLKKWVLQVSNGASPVFVGFNAGFDWSFVNWYFIHFMGENIFGFAPLDIKSYYMGLTGCRWTETKSSQILPEYQPAVSGNHNALADAKSQGEMFQKMRGKARIP